MSSSRAVWYMVASALGFSTMSMLVKLVSERGIPVGEIVLARAVVTLVASYVMVRRAGVPLWGTRRVGLAFRGLLGFGGLSLYYLSLSHLPLADATVIQHLNPLLVAILAFWLLGEQVGWPTLIAIVFGICGVLMVVHPNGASSAPHDLLGVAIALGATLCSSVAYVTVRQLAKTEHPLVIVWYFPLIATPLIIPWAAANWIWPSPIEWLLLLLIGLTTQIGQVFMTMALAIERAGRVTTLGFVQVAFAMMWQWAVFANAPTLWTLGGALLIVAGITLIAVVGSPKRTPT